MHTASESMNTHAGQKAWMCKKTWCVDQKSIDHKIWAGFCFFCSSFPNALIFFCFVQKSDSVKIAHTIYGNHGKGYMRRSGTYIKSNKSTVTPCRSNVVWIYVAWFHVSFFVVVAGFMCILLFSSLLCVATWKDEIGMTNCSFSSCSWLFVVVVVLVFSALLEVW